ncbi:hypothetical protein [Pseudoalteromonas viridis]|nr:hypothetical protein [Pseudoalteromonas viridis]
MLDARAHFVSRGLRDELQTGWSASNWASSVEPPQNIALALTGG